jgi:hypothetical protein
VLKLVGLVRMESQYIWKPPTFDTSRQPTLVREAHLPSDPDLHENFARSAKWCPDGSLALAHCENRSLQYLDLPQDLLNATLPQSGPLHIVYFESGYMSYCLCP